MTSETKMNTLVSKRPWGKFEQFTRNESSTVKILTINAKESISLQKHANREEFWKIISGQGTVIIGEKEFTIAGGQEYFIGKNVAHRIKAGREKAVVLEISFGDFEEDDETRLEDAYNR